MSNDHSQDDLQSGSQRLGNPGSTVLSLREVRLARAASSGRAPRTACEVSRQETTGATVYLVDDDSASLLATSRLLAAKGFSVTAFNSATDLLSRVSAESRGCVVTDLVMPDVTGLELQALLGLRGVGMPVVFLTGRGDIPSVVQAMRGGAVDLLEKPAPCERLLTAITHALEKDAETYAARTRREERRRRIAALTEREREVFALVARGWMNKQIAAALGIHERTVKLHRTSITTKLRVHAVAQLAVLASEAGLLESETLVHTVPLRASVENLPVRPSRRMGFPREADLVGFS